MNDLLVLGAGGFGRVVADMARDSGRFKTVRHLDDNLGHGVIGRLTDFVHYIDNTTYFFVALGNNSLRLEWLNKIKHADGKIATLLHSRAYISPSAEISSGSIVMPMAVVNTEVKIAQGCIINCGAIIDHGCIIEQGCHICLGAVVKAENRIFPCTKIEARTVVEARLYQINQY